LETFVAPKRQAQLEIKGFWHRPQQVLYQAVISSFTQLWKCIFRLLGYQPKQVKETVSA
jgi:hypothetical protein